MVTDADEYWVSWDKESLNDCNNNLLIGILLITGTWAEECAIELCIFALASGTWLFATALDKLSHFLDCLNFCHPQRLPFHNGTIDLFPSKVFWRGKVLLGEQTFAPRSTLIDCSPCVEKKRITCRWNCLNVVWVSLKIELHWSLIDWRESWSSWIHENHKALNFVEFGIFFCHILKRIAVDISKSFFCLFTRFQNIQSFLLSNKFESIKGSETELSVLKLKTLKIAFFDLFCGKHS